MSAGVNVVLGTDSVASNENLALLEEARFVWQNVPDPPRAEALLRMVTLNAARALELHAHIGSLEAGKQADVIAFGGAGAVPDPAAWLVEQAPAPTHVWVAGQRVV